MSRAKRKMQKTSNLLQDARALIAGRLAKQLKPNDRSESDGDKPAVSSKRRKIANLLRSS